MTAVKVLAFAGARDVIGADELMLEIGAAATAGELLDLLCRRYPGLEPHRRSLRIAVNGSYAQAGDPVCAGDEVAVIPPVAGG